MAATSTRRTSSVEKITGRRPATVNYAAVARPGSAATSSANTFITFMDAAFVAVILPAVMISRWQHMITPRPVGHRCYGKGCNKKFLTMSDMFIHLEEGTCPSQITLKDINAVVAMHTDAHSIVHFDYNKSFAALLNRQEPPELPFQCPGTRLGAACKERFELFSGLLQHSESQDCTYTFGQSDGDLLPFLQKILYSESARFKIETLKKKFKGRPSLVYQSMARDESFDKRFSTLATHLQHCLKRVHLEDIQTRLEMTTVDCEDQILRPRTRHLLDLDHVLELQWRYLGSLTRLHAWFTAAKNGMARAERRRERKILVLYTDMGNSQPMRSFLEEADAVLHILKLEISVDDGVDDPASMPDIPEEPEID
ncbi:hypothetical protein Dda_2640 [Drechslerella dactyloides]|uniref:C2H2-type domain-containing protein n=1 Tax=Drechslerella dactyloides TaxID=74499 RepID=A0AAD6J482_DREDA|nr:hypothetical protein Dda_2640 [Drechslerella dactyloides]